MISKRFTLGLSAALLGGLVANDSRASVALVNDTFDIGSPPTLGDDAADPYDVAWTNRVGATMTLGSSAPIVSSGNYLNADSTQSFMCITGQLPTHSDFNLDTPGKSITLSFDIRFRGSSYPTTTANFFRFGLFDSAGYGIAAGAGNKVLDPRFDPIPGIDANMGAGPGGFNSFSWYTGGSETLGTYTNDIVPNALFTATLTIVRVATNQIDVTATFDTAVATASTTNTSITEGFITNFSGGHIMIRFATGSSANHDFRVDNVKVVPEPTGVGALALASGMGLVLRRRASGCRSVTS